MTVILAVLVVSSLIGLLRGGQLRNLTGIYVRGWWLLPLGLLLQIGASYVPEDTDWGSGVAVTLLLISYVLLLTVASLNRSEPGIWIAGLGVLMNLIVIAGNGGMPVSAEAVGLAGGEPTLMFGAKHVALDDSSLFPFLADVIAIPGNVISLGDVFLAIGVGIFIEDHMRRPPQLFHHGIRGVPGSAAE